MSTIGGEIMKKLLMASAAAVALNAVAFPAFAGMEEAQKWIDEEFQPSTLSKAEQYAEMEWFMPKRSEPYARAWRSTCCRKTIPTHSV
jgi:glycerol transport system substrate-binding protein